MVYAAVAQLVEQLICNHQVPSSNLGCGTIFIEFNVGVWPSGKAAVFGIAIPGSNPGTPAIFFFSLNRTQWIIWQPFWLLCLKRDVDFKDNTNSIIGKMICIFYMVS
tara:strand:- start:155 stop:475 length:321 start_codon:yes stop_codon:yes gene_type:complete